MSTRPVVAVVPFGARGGPQMAGAWARQLARRLVERFARDANLELRPVFLVAMPEGPGQAGHLVLGSSPGPDLAAQYAASLDASHALTAALTTEADGRTIEATLVDAASRAVLDRRTFSVATGALPVAETDIASWLVAALGVTATSDLATLAAANEDAYTAILEAMDHEIDATLLRPGDAPRAAVALGEALRRYLDAARADPKGAVAEDRLLVLAAESLERGDVTAETDALVELIGLRPRSWRAHYILGQLRAEARDANGAIVAFEHAQSLHALPDADLVRLAELYAHAGAPAAALAHLRRIAPSSRAYGAAQELLAIISFQRDDPAIGREAFARAVAAGTTSWELHAAYGAAVHAQGQTAEAAAHYRDALVAGAPAVVRLNLARVLLASGDRDAAVTELDTLLAAEKNGEIAGHARRLRFGLREPELEHELERAGQAALAGEAAALDPARVVFERALAIDPALWEAYFGIGIVARQRGDAAAAQASFRRALELWPDQPDAVHELGVALLMGDDAAGALAALDHAAALRPEDPAYVADAGFAHLRAGDLARARQRLERAARLDADDPITKSYLGELERAEAEVGKR